MHFFDVGFGRGTVVAMVLAAASLFALPDAPARAGCVVVTDTETTILDVVEFEPSTATLRTASLPTLDAVAATLLGNPSIALVEVQSHTRDTGHGAANLALSSQRADAVTAYLVASGVSPSRLVAQGYGDTQPLDLAAPAKNERVAFLILRRSTDEDAPIPIR